MATFEAPKAAEDSLPEPRDERSWLLLAFPVSSQWKIAGSALLITLGILALEFVVEVLLLDLPYWQGYDTYLHDPGVPLSAIGLFFALTTLGQWGQRYIELWARVRPAFAVRSDEYYSVVLGGLGDLYGRDYVPFAWFVVVQLVVYSAFGPALPAGFIHIGFLHFFAVSAVYSFYRHVELIKRVDHLNLYELNHARQTLSAVADFSVWVAFFWFAALSALAVYIVILGVPSRAVTLFFIAMLVVLIVLGFLAFFVPVYMLHRVLANGRSEQLRHINQQIANLLERLRDGKAGPNASTELDILEIQRTTIKESSTWPYRLVSMTKIAIASVFPAVLSVLQQFLG